MQVALSRVVVEQTAALERLMAGAGGVYSNPVHQPCISHSNAHDCMDLFSMQCMLIRRACVHVTRLRVVVCTSSHVHQVSVFVLVLTSGGGCHRRGRGEGAAGGKLALYACTWTLSMYVHVRPCTRVQDVHCVHGHPSLR